MSVGETFAMRSLLWLGIDVSANQDSEVTDKETFQLEMDKRSKQWRVRSADNKYWSLEAASGIQDVGNAT